MQHFKKSCYFAADFIYSKTNMNTKLTLVTLILSISVILGSCASQNDEPALSEGTGTITLGVTTSTAFTKAVDESSYSNVDNYSVQILNDAGTPVKEFLYSEREEKITLNNGSYTLKAFYGTESNASRESFYVVGNTSFQVNGEPVQAVAVTCQPTCGKVKATFASNMDEYFSDYSIVYETAALKAAGSTAVWAKGDKDPWYLKVDNAGETVTATIQCTRLSDNKTATVERTYTLAPNKSWTLNIAPSDDNGSLGIEITVDETTDDETIDIEVPADWV